MSDRPPRRCRGCGKKLRPDDGPYCTQRCRQQHSNVAYLPGAEKRPQPPGDETA